VELAGRLSNPRFLVELRALIEDPVAKPDGMAGEYGIGKCSGGYK
jgi:hypothetical protein